VEVDLRGLLGKAPARPDRHGRAPFAVARKIAVIGTPCSGKTTLARQLANRFAVPHVELDALFHGPNWTPAPADEFRDSVERALSGDGWIADGNYRGKLGDLVLERADLVVWLDLPLRIIMWRLWRRTLHRIRGNVELWAGNRETWRNVFLTRQSLFVWAVRKHVQRRRTLPGRLARFNTVRLRSAAEMAAWLAQQRR
jgi:adenylate kinase family enzyme